ncbi:hypothetical protein JCM8202_003968 [Rhodotorula sphaerocarpa]
MEDSPWGAPDDSFGATLPKPPSPPVDIAPLPSSLSLAAPSWGDEGDAWGSSNDTYALPVSSPGAGSSSAPYGRDNDHPTLPSSAAPDFRDDAWPTEDTTGHFPGPDATGGDHLADDSMPTRIPSPPPLPVHAHDPYDGGDSAEPHGVRGGGAASPHDDGEERGWGGASPDLPPISSLRLAGSPSPDDDGRAAGWTPEAAENFDEDIPPPPLPTVEEVFASAKPRRDSAEAAGGGDAWGSSQGWEERMRAEAEARAQERGDEPEEDTSTQAQEQEASDGPARTSSDAPAAPSGLSSILGKFRKGAEDGAAKSTEIVKGATSAASQTAGQLAQATSDTLAQSQGEGQAPAKSSWFGRRSKPAEPQAPPPQKKSEEEEDPRTLGVEEVETGGSGRASAEEPVQPSAIGRFFSRLKRGPASNPDEGGEKTPSPRTSGDMPSEIRPDDLDALATGRISSARSPASAPLDDDFDPAPTRSGFFASRGKASAAQVPMGPPEDDFGGLIGALAAAPSPSSGGGRPTAFDPLDPLSDSYGAVPSIPALNKPKSAPSTRPTSMARPSRPAAPASPARRVQPTPTQLATSSPPRTSATIASFPARVPSVPAISPAASRTGDDSFDAFFDSVAASTTSSRPASQPKPSVPPIPSNVRSPSPLLPTASSGASKPRAPAPAPRMTISPPPRASTASPASSIGSGGARATTPIMPLPPPPPPSQPVAGGARSLNILGPSPPASASPPAFPSSAAASGAPPRIPTPLGAVSAPLAPSPVLAPAPASGGSKPLSPAAGAVPQRPKSSGPLSMDDLSFFET